MRKWSFLLLLWCASCAPLPIRPPAVPLPEELISLIQNRSHALQGSKGLAHVRVSAPGKNFSLQEVILARRPGFLRLESLSPLGTPQFYLVTNGRELYMYHPGENRYYRGLAKAQHLSSILPLPLEPEELVTFLLGGFPLLPYEQAFVHEDPKENLWILDLTHSSREDRQTFGIHWQSRQLIFVEYRLQGITRRLAFADFRPSADFVFPHQIHFESPEYRTEFTIAYRELELNPSWDEADFQLPVPRGAQVIVLE